MRLDMPRFNLTRTTCLLVLSAALTSVIFFYPSVTAARDAAVHPEHELPSDPFSQDSHLAPIKQHNRQWPWLSLLSSGVMDQEREGVNVVYGADGLVRGWEPRETSSSAKFGYTKLSEKVRRRHPIHDLILQGQERWAALLER